MLQKIFFNIPDWGNRWIPHILHALRKFDRVNDPAMADILFSAWCNEKVVEWSHAFPGKKIVTYCRRYEIYQEPFMQKMNWGAVSAVVFVSDYMRSMFLRMPHVPDAAKKTVPLIVIPNGIDVGRFPYRDVVPLSHKIALIASTRWVKGHQLAAQILMELPDEYQIVSIGMGGSPDYAVTVAEYYLHLGLEKRFVHEGLVPSKAVLAWLMDKECLLSTSMSEGNPMNILEAMAMGIKPVIHAWPGAKKQFPENLVFRTAREAAGIIVGDPRVYTPEVYRAWVEDRYSARNFDHLGEVVDGL